MLGLAFSLFEGNSILSLGRHGSLFNGNKKNPCFAIILFDHISDFSGNFLNFIYFPYIRMKNGFKTL